MANGEFTMIKELKLKYIGQETASLITGKIYDGCYAQGNFYGVIDESGEEYGFPRKFFEIVDEK